MMPHTVPNSPTNGVTAAGNREPRHIAFQAGDLFRARDLHRALNGQRDVAHDAARSRPLDV